MFAYTTTLRTPSMMPAFTSTGRLSRQGVHHVKSSGRQHLVRALEPHLVDADDRAVVTDGRRSRVVPEVNHPTVDPARNQDRWFLRRFACPHSRGHLLEVPPELRISGYRRVTAGIPRALVVDGQDGIVLNDDHLIAEVERDRLR